MLKHTYLFFSLLIVALFGYSCDNSDNVRAKINFDFDWQFSKGDLPDAKDVEFDDSSWQGVDLPHDWDISSEFKKSSSAGRTAAYAEGGVAWYRKTFSAEALSSYDKISVEFGSVYMNSEVWINGHYLGKRPYGYISFCYDLTPYLHFDRENVISVRVDNSKQPSTRWYTGSGIHRHVWLIATGDLHIARHGVYTYTDKVEDDVATVAVEVNVENGSSDDQRYTLQNSIYTANGEVVAQLETQSSVAKDGSNVLAQSLEIDNPDLWSPQSPYLYTLKSVVMQEGEIVDVVETKIGVRTFNFDANSGFSLNGESMKIQGVNEHSDLGCLGGALNDRALERRLEILKEMGCNAIRTAHNPSSEEFLHMCDSMGFLVMAEAFDEWLESWPFGGVKPPEGKAKYGYHLYFEEWAERDLVEFMMRDRNHPCVILWSLGNEIPDACFEVGTERLKRLMEVAREVDRTRPLTSGITHMHLANASGYADALDVVGYNGGGGNAFRYEEDHRDYPERIIIASEVPHSYQTRGVYRTLSSYRDRYNLLGGVMEVPDFTKEEVFPEFSKFHSSSYDNAMVRIGSIDSWKRTSRFPYVAGEFRWTGFDYLGESFYEYPAKLWNFGIIDLCGFPKDIYYFYKSVWTDEAMVHILPHWNWSGKEGVEIPVVAYSNCDSVELLLNGQSLGEQEMTDDLFVKWMVAYESGELVARGRRDGEVVCEKVIVTADAPSQIEMLTDRDVIGVSRHDIVHLEVNVLDKDGNFVPNADNRIDFKIDGDATILGIDNGDAVNVDSFVGSSVKAFNGKCLLIVRSNGNAGKFTVTATSKGLTSAQTTIHMRRTASR